MVFDGAPNKLANLWGYFYMYLFKACDALLTKEVQELEGNRSHMKQ